MKALQMSFIFGFILALFAVAANGYPHMGPYDVFRARSARWPTKPAATIRDQDGAFLNGNESEQDYYRLISYLNDVGRRR